MKYKYENLGVWKLAQDLILKIYNLTERFPKSEDYNLTSQIKRAAVSVNLNIAEGSMRRSDKEFGRFINISLGSLVEVDTCLKIAVRLNYLEPTALKDTPDLIEKLFSMLVGLRKSLSKGVSVESDILDDLDGSE